MNKKILKFFALFLISTTVYAAWDDVIVDKKNKKPEEGDLVSFTGRGNTIEASGVKVSDVSNMVAFAESIGTNDVSNLEYKVNKDAANGYAGLDENGKISTNAIANIIIVYTGGSAFE